MKKVLPGILLRSEASEFGSRVYYVDKGHRHWVRDASWLGKNGFRWPDDVIDVEPRVLYSFLNAGSAPLKGFEDLGSQDLGSLDLREICGTKLRGTGIEFGAGATPFPAPLHCKVLFADAFSYDFLSADMYPGQTAHNLINPDFVTDIQTLTGIADNSLDFIVACHVIEHTTNPIGAIRSCHRALKAGGSLVLVVPDMEKSFDKGRALTSLEHLVEDYLQPSRQRDRSHYEEFYTLAFTPPANSNVEEYITQKHAEDFAIHFHTWNFDSFNQMVKWTADQMGWSDVWRHPTLPGEENIEFYFVLTK